MNIRHVFERIYDFNRSVIATNIDSETKNCNAYRLNPEKLIDKSIYPEVPHGI